MKSWWVLRRQPLGETDWLLDVFTRDAGMLRVTWRRPPSAPDLHREYQGDWVATDELPRLRGVSEIHSEARTTLTGDALVCALYLDELLLKILGTGQASPTLYKLYAATLQALAEQQRRDVWLRVFETTLLHQAGVLPDLTMTAAGDAVEELAMYQYRPGEGIVRAPQETSYQETSHGTRAWSGQQLRALMQQDYRLPGALTAARVILRSIIDEHVSQPLISPELL